MNRDDLERKAKELGVPLIQPLPDKPFGPNPTVAICGQCGMEMKQMMGYVCNSPNCPCFPRITC